MEKNAIITFYFDKEKEIFSKKFVDLGFVKTCDEFVMYLAHRIQHPILKLRILYFQEVFNQ